MGPEYDGKYLRSLTNGLLGNLTVKQTLTDVIIPTFDIKLLQPVIFSTNDVWYDKNKYTWKCCTYACEWKSSNTIYMRTISFTNYCNYNNITFTDFIINTISIMY